MSGISRARTLVVQHVLAAAVLALFVPVVAHAGAITYSNKGGTASCTLGGVAHTTCTVAGTNDTFSLKNSAIDTLDGNSVMGMGYTLSFTTSSSFSGSLSTGGSWASGGTFTINLAGTGVIFSGTFSGPVTWTLTSAANCTSCQYVLSGALSGTIYPAGEGNGPGFAILSGATAQIDLTSTGLYNGSNHITDMGGTTGLVTPVPEPGSLALLGTGFLGMGFAIRRKVKGAMDALRNW